MYKDIQPCYHYSFQNFTVLCTPVHSPVVDSNLQPLRFTVVYSPVIYSSLVLWFTVVYSPVIYSGLYSPVIYSMSPL